VALYTTLASLSQTAGANAADGSTDAPSTIDQQTNSLASFIAQLRDGVGFSNGVRGAASGSTTTAINLTLTAADVGKFINLAAVNLTITLPASSTISPGALFYFRGAAKYSLLRSSTDTITSGIGTGLTTAIVYGASIVIWSGTEWQVQVGGDGAVVAQTGYQRFPSGLVMQWGSTVGVTSASSAISVTFPIAFASSSVCVVVSNGDIGSSVSAAGLANGTLTTTGFAATFSQGAVGIGAGVGVRANWTAFGQA